MGTATQYSPEALRHQAKSQGVQVENLASGIIADYAESLEVANYLLAQPEALEPASPEEQAEFMQYMQSLLADEGRGI